MLLEDKFFFVEYFVYFGYIVEVFTTFFFRGVFFDILVFFFSGGVSLRYFILKLTMVF